jgi:hypothetical protein
MYFGIVSSESIEKTVCYSTWRNKCLFLFGKQGLHPYDEGLLARGKLRKVALVAAMRTLLLAVYSVAKHRRPFVPHLIPQETPA